MAFLPAIQCASGRSQRNFLRLLYILEFPLTARQSSPSTPLKKRPPPKLSPFAAPNKQSGSNRASMRSSRSPPHARGSPHCSVPRLSSPYFSRAARHPPFSILSSSQCLHQLLSILPTSSAPNCRCVVGNGRLAAQESWLVGCAGRNLHWGTPKADPM